MSARLICAGLKPRRSGRSRRTPSPRVRGEGWGEGASPLGAEMCGRRLQRCSLDPAPATKLRLRGPLILVASHARLLPARGEKRISVLVLAMRLRIRGLPRHCKKALPGLPKKEGRRSAERRDSSRPCSTEPARATRRMLPLAGASGALAFRRSTAVLASWLTHRPLAQLQAMLPGTRVGRALPALAYPSPGTAPPAPAVVPA